MTLTTGDVAKQLGISLRRIRQLAKSRKVGTQLTDGTWIFAEGDLKKLQHHAPGRPVGNKSQLTKAEFKSLLATAAQPRRSQPPDSGEIETSAGHLSDDYNDSHTHQDNAEGT